MKGTNKIFALSFSAVCLIAGVVCAICNYAISGEMTWAYIPISSLVFLLIVAILPMVVSKGRVIAALSAFTTLIVPYLYTLSVILDVKAVFSIGAAMALIGVLYMWSVAGVFKKLKGRKYTATGISLLLAIPLQFIINIVLSKMISEPIIDMWDIFVVAVLLIISVVLFVSEKPVCR